MTALAWIVEALALLVQIAAHLFVMSVLLFASSILTGRVASRLVKWLNTRRLRVDFGPHKSRGWTP